MEFEKTEYKPDYIVPAIVKTQWAIWIKITTLLSETFRFGTRQRPKKKMQQQTAVTQTHVAS